MSNDFQKHEQDLGKVYDHKIIGRLFHFAKPYTAWLLLALILAALMSGSQILLPYLTKVGIDSYILMKGKLVDLSSLEGINHAELMTKYQDRLVQLSGPRFVIQEGVLDPQDRKLFIESGALIDGDYYLLDLSRYQPDDSQTVSTLLTDGTIRAEAARNPNQYILETSDYYALEKSQKQLLRKPDRKGIRNIALLFLVVLVSSLGVMFFQVYVMAWVGQKIMFDIRTKLFDHIQRLPLQYFNNQPTGRLVTRVSNDVNVLNEVFTSILVEMVKNLLMIVGITVVMLKLAPRLALVTFCILPPMILITWYFKRRMRDAYREVRQKIALINATLAEHLNGIKVIQAFGRERLHYKKFKSINRQAYKANMTQLFTQASFSPFIVFLENLGIALILFYGGGQTFRNAISLGTLVAFLSYLNMFFGPVRDIAEKFNILQSAMASSERIFQLLDTDIEDAEDNGNALITDSELTGQIEFKNVWFAYESDDWVLKDVSFTVNAGETVAFVGATGSGKTTIINLLTRFFMIQKGEIQVDGKNLHDYDRRFIRKNMAMVLQDVFLFSGDIYRNIRLNNAEITDEQIHKVSRYVHADTFIERLSDQYSHTVKEGGSTLSQGQRQLLAFARALAMDPSLLILDEATANIDSETEKWIQKGLDKLLDDRTALVVAHRLSTIQKADKIIVLHRGQIKEIGNHQELLSRRGIYYKLYQLQFKQQEKQVG